MQSSNSAKIVPYKISYKKILFCTLLATLLTLCVPNAYRSYYLTFTTDVRSLGSSQSIELLYHSPDAPNEWPTVKPSGNDQVATDSFATFTFHIPVQRIDTIHVLLGEGNTPLELRNMRLDENLSFSIKDTWSANPAGEKITEQNGTIIVTPLMDKQPRVQLNEFSPPINSHSFSIRWLRVFSIWSIFLLITFAPIQAWIHIRRRIFVLSEKPTSVLTLLCGNTRTCILSIIILAIATIFYITVYQIITLSWFGHDDYGLALALEQNDQTNKINFLKAWHSYSYTYQSWNARIGEFFAFLIKSHDRLVHRLVTPFLMVLLSFILYRLANKKSLRLCIGSIIIYIVANCLLLMGINHNPWINICDQAAATNYLWSTAINLAFCSFYVKNFTKTSKIKWHWRIPYSITFIIWGIIAGMGIECLSVTVVMFLLIYLIIHFSQRRIISPALYMGIIGYIIGAIMLLTSPALTARALGGGCVPRNLSQMPWIEKLSYYPELCQAYWQCSKISYYILFACLFILLIASVRASPQKRKLILIHVGQAMLYVIASWICFSSYIAGAIPYPMSFLPAGYILIVAILSLMFRIHQHLSWRWTLLPALPLFAYTGLFVSNTLYYARLIKPYETIRKQNIIEARQRGETNIHLPYPLPYNYDPNKGHLMFSKIVSDPSNFHTKAAALYYQVNSITEDASPSATNKDTSRK